MSVALPAQTLDLLSICTGGGGLDLGIELALPGARSVVMVEREAFAVAHLVAAMEQGLLAPAAVWSDARTFDGRPWRGLVDGLIGGIPCQPHSMAGRKRGSLDSRDLWSTARRIIVHARPWLVLIENVAGMLSAGADEIAGAERVWRDLRRLGFAVEIGLFSAAEVGASHERQRVFILGVADTGGERGEAGLSAASCGIGQPAGPTIALDDRGRLADPDQERRQRRPAGQDDHSEGWHHAKPCDGGHARLRDGADVADTGSDGLGARFQRDLGARPEGGAAFAAPSDTCLADAPIARGRAVFPGPWQPRQTHPDAHWPSLFPPGPADLDGWRGVLAHSPDLEPAVRRMADGVAARLDLSGPHAARVDRLRLLGNGVVSLEAAHAFRTLVARLAARGSAAAARLLLMMGSGQ